MTKVTESLFYAAKALINAGAPYKEVTKYFNISDATCKLIKGAENFNEYKNMIAAACAKNRARKAKKEEAKEKKEVVLDKVETDPPVQVVEHRQSVTIQATHFMMQEMQETNKLLKEISNKVAFLVEQLA